MPLFITHNKKKGGKWLFKKKGEKKKQFQRRHVGLLSGMQTQGQRPGSWFNIQNE